MDVMISMKAKSLKYEDLTDQEKTTFNVQKRKKILGNMNFIGELFKQ